MKTKTTLLILVLLALSIRGFSQIGIGTTSPNASAALDVTSTTSGLLPPRMTELQRNNINAPAAGLMVYCTDCGAKGEPQYYNGTSWVNMVGGAAAPLTSTVFVAPGVPITFLAHNLGANNSLDPHTPVQGIHGNYYQWGILAHVADASTPATAITPWNTTTAANGAWADGSKTANDPCPTGYRVPTNAQWLLVDSYNTQTTTGSFSNNETNFGTARQFGSGANTLTLPSAGYRSSSNGALGNRGSNGYYWSSTANGPNAFYLSFGSSNASTFSANRTFGFSVRCVSE
jgi:uncharacterized protein (TIGR02145 family)